MTPLQQVAEQARSLYEITGDIKDINKMVVERSTRRQALELEQQAEPKKGSYEAVTQDALDAEQQDTPIAWKTIEEVAQDRYKVVPSDSSMFYRFAVVAGDGTQQLFIGRELECQNMARKFAGAFLDGAFIQEKMIAHPQPVQQLIIPPGYKLVPVEPTDSMLSAWFRCDRWARDGSWQAAYRDMLDAAPEAPAQRQLTEAQIAILAAVERAIDFTDSLVRDAK